MLSLDIQNDNPQSKTIMVDILNFVVQENF